MHDDNVALNLRNKATLRYAYLYAFDKLWWLRLGDCTIHILLDYRLRICSIVNHLDLIPEVTTHFFATDLHLIARVLHQVAYILQMPLYNDLDVFLTLIKSCSSLQFFVLFFKDEIQLVLFGLNESLHALVGLFLELDPLVRRLLHKHLPHALHVFTLRAAK